jgi:PAS domain S-box-containing protein
MDAKAFAGKVGAVQNITEPKQTAEALRESEERFRHYFELGLIGMAITSPTKVCLEVNDQMCQILGYERRELLGMTWVELTHPDDLAADAAQFDRVLAGEIDGYTIDKRFIRKDCQIIHTTISVKCMRRADGAVEYFVALLQDITERVQATEALRLYADRLKIIHEIDRAILAARSPVEIARVALNQLRQLVPYQRGGVVVIGPKGLRAIALIVDSQGDFRVDTNVQLPPELFGWHETSAAAKESYSQEYASEPLICDDPPPIVRALLADGVCSYMALPLVSQGILIGALGLGAGQEYAFTSAHLDIACEVADSVAIAIQQARLNEQISVGRERLRSLTRRLVAHQEIERRQIAQELHDQVGQTLTALNISLSIARTQLSAEAIAKVGARLDESTRLIEETMARIRDVMATLRPAVLDDYGLAAALHWYTQQFSERTGLEVTLQVDQATATLRLAPEIETALFRTTQEALTNVVKHARVGRAAVALKTDRRALRLIVVDRGVGFDPAEPQAADERRGLGLIGMRERVEAVGGRLRLESAPGQGTLIVAEVGR